MPGWLVVAVGGLLIAAGAVLPALSRRGRRRDLEAAAAGARAATLRLGYCCETLHAGRDPVTERLLADATERWHTAGGLLAGARDPGELAVAEAVAREGLDCVTRACRRLRIPVPL